MGTSLEVQWLGLGAFTVWPKVQSLVRELRSHKPLGVGWCLVVRIPGFHSEAQVQLVSHFDFRIV